LGTLKWKPAVEPLLELLEDKNLEKARNSIIGTLGSIGEIEAAKPIHKYLNADTEKRRITTMGALGALKDSTAIESMTELLNDKFFTVRSRAMMTISGFGALAIPHLLDYIGNEDSDHPESALYIIGRIARNLEKKEDVASKKTIYEASTILNGHLSNQREHMRAEAVVGLYRIGGEETRRLIDARMENEFNPVVLAAHERVTKEMAGK
jgi:HEAT repeat protein